MRTAFLLVTALLIGACTDDQGGFGETPPTSTAAESHSPLPKTPSVQVATVVATSDLRFVPHTLELKADRVTEFVLRNKDRQDHTFSLAMLPVAMLAGPGQTVRTTVTLGRPSTGAYLFLCSIHRAEGMEGTILVV